MGCCVSSPHSGRRYRDPADLDEEIVPIRYFGTTRAGSNLVPDDLSLPSTHLHEFLPVDPNPILYEAEIDHGRAFRCLRPSCCLVLPFFPAMIAAGGAGSVVGLCKCDEACCWVRKEYSTRNFYRVYANRIQVNQPAMRIPFGFLGCGSWNGDNILTHPFDRGAFGFSRVQCGVLDYMCCVWPLYGGVVARHRCECNGPLWNRMFTDCGGWWCDEWPCQMFLCTYRYPGLENPDEVAFASSIALQAYFEGRRITPSDMERCVQFWRANISEQTDPIGRKRRVCCEPYSVPLPQCSICYACVHPNRTNPYGKDDSTEELVKVYDKYKVENDRQDQNYQNFYGPVHYSTVCRALGCRRLFGRKGFIFCTEGCCSGCDRKAGDPAPPFADHDLDDTWDASTILNELLGPPPANVVIRRWRYDPERGEDVLETISDEKWDQAGNGAESENETSPKDEEKDVHA